MDTLPVRIILEIIDEESGIFYGTAAVDLQAWNADHRRAGTIP